MRLRELAELLGGDLSGEDAEFRRLVTDNREVEEGDVFIAIKGSRFDGAEFVGVAATSGAIASITERAVCSPHIRVGSVVGALARMASHLRSRFNGAVVGVTGSAGKTTTKEFIASALSPLGTILKTEANRNTEYTAPLLWLEADPPPAAIVVEMGMRGPSQIRHLASFAKPTIGVITNVGVAHLELLGTQAAIADAKAELLDALPSVGTAILPADDNFLTFLRRRAPANVATFGFDPDADSRIVSVESISWIESSVSLLLNEELVQVRVPAVGRHFARNAAAAMLVASRLGVDPTDAAEAIGQVKLPSMRMQLVERRGIRIVMDAYNASPPAVIASLETLNDFPSDGPKSAVLGEMRELGTFAEAGHREVGRALAGSEVNRVCLYGPSTKWIAEEWVAAGRPPESIFIAGSLYDVRRFLGTLNPGDTVLVKGSRGLELERALEEDRA